MLTPALFFTSGLGLGVWLMSDDDPSLRSGVGHESDDVLVLATVSSTANLHTEDQPRTVGGCNLRQCEPPV
jgi:hypothetical protein